MRFDIQILEPKTIAFYCEIRRVGLLGMVSKKQGVVSPRLPSTLFVAKVCVFAFDCCGEGISILVEIDCLFDRC